MHHHPHGPPIRIGIGIMGPPLPPPPPRPIIIGDPFLRPLPPPPPMYGYGYRRGYYDDGEVVCCCGIF